VFPNGEVDSCSLGGPILTYNWSILLSFIPLDSLGRLRLTADYNGESTSISSGFVIEYKKQYQAVELNEKHQDSSNSMIKKEGNIIKIAESMDGRPK